MDPQIHMHTCAPSQNTLQGQKTTKNIQLLKFAKGWDALNRDGRPRKYSIEIWTEFFW